MRSIRWFAWRPPLPRPAEPQPVFVIGSMRSGASLLALSMAQHPSVAAATETGWIERFALGLEQTFVDAVAGAANPSIAARTFERGSFFSHFGDAISRMHAGESSATRWIDSTYTNAFLVAPLARLFPNGRFIHVLRDVDSVVASLTSAENRRSYRSQHRQLSVRDAYEHWLDVTMACVEAERCLGSDVVMRIRREDLVQDPENSLRRCFDFVGESFGPETLRPFAGLDSDATTVRPFSSDVDEPWRLQADLFSRTLLNECVQDYAPDPVWRARLDAAFLRRCATPR